MLHATSPNFASIFSKCSGAVTARQEAEQLGCWHCRALAGSMCCLGKKED